MLIQLFEYSFLFFIIGHPNWLILGLLACITTIIPYFGGLITNILAIIMASVVSVPLVIATIVICMIFPQLDGYLISPKVYGKTNNVKPVVVIISITAGGILFGITGIIASFPVAIILIATYKFYKEEIFEKLGDMKDSKKK